MPYINLPSSLLVTNVFSCSDKSRVMEQSALQLFGIGPCNVRMVNIFDATLSSKYTKVAASISQPSQIIKGRRLINNQQKEYSASQIKPHKNHQNLMNSYSEKSVMLMKSVEIKLISTIYHHSKPERRQNIASYHTQCRPGGGEMLPTEEQRLSGIACDDRLCRKSVLAATLRVETLCPCFLSGANQTFWLAIGCLAYINGFLHFS